MQASEISQLQTDIRNCQKCHLYKTLPEDSTPVFGEGNPNAKLMFIGEAPGEEEILFNRPFIGPAGRLLDKILISAGIDRKECYVSNIIHCRPTVNNKGIKNRPPSDLEIKFCKKWIWLEIQTLVNLKITVTLGKIATHTLLHQQFPKGFSILKIMGDKYKVPYHQSCVVPLPHPSFLLVHGKQHIQKTVEILKEIKELL